MTSRIWARIENLFYRHVEESSGNDPQSVSHRSHCLANKSRRLQGLLSIVFTTGYDPITSDVSDRRSTNWATWTYCGQGRVRSYNLSVNSRLLYQLSYLSILLWERRDSNPQGLTTTDLQSAEPTNCSTLPFCTLYRDRTCDLLYVKQPLLPSELRVCFMMLSF